MHTNSIGTPPLTAAVLPQAAPKPATASDSDGDNDGSAPAAAAKPSGMGALLDTQA